MALQTSGTISIDDIRNEFGATDGAIDAYYRGGGIVVDAPVNNSVPTSGTISLEDFYGASKVLNVVARAWGGGGAGAGGLSNSSSAAQTNSGETSYVALPNGTNLASSSGGAGGIIGGAAGTAGTAGAFGGNSQGSPGPAGSVNSNGQNASGFSHGGGGGGGDNGGKNDAQGQGGTGGGGAATNTSAATFIAPGTVLTVYAGFYGDGLQAQASRGGDGAMGWCEIDVTASNGTVTTYSFGESTDYGFNAQTIIRGNTGTTQGEHFFTIPNS
jgi:hypothetical protein